jgi:transcriptional regulator with XRE-family HTH domain
MPSNADLGRALRSLRKARHLSIESLAFAAGMHPTYLSGIERGVRNPTWQKVCLLAAALNVTVADVVGRAESAERVRRGMERVLADEQDRQAAGQGVP